MILAVLDTNVLISSLIGSEDSPSHSIFQSLKEKQFISVTSMSILAEIDDVVNRERIYKKYQITDKERLQFAKNIGKLSIVTAGNFPVDFVHKDPDDNKFIACASEGSADFIVSGDHHLLDIGKIKNIRIVAPREFNDILVSHRPSQLM